MLPSSRKCIKYQAIKPALSAAIPNATQDDHGPKEKCAAATETARRNKSAARTAALFAIVLRCRVMTLPASMRTVNQVEEREKKHPDHVDEMPVQADVLDRLRIDDKFRFTPNANPQDEENQKADRHMDSVSAR